VSVPEQHDEALSEEYTQRRAAHPDGLTLRQRIKANRRSLELASLIIILALVNFLWTSATANRVTHNEEKAAAARQAAEQQAIRVAVAQANQQWCDLVGAINAANGHAPPPSTPYGRNLNNALQQRYITLGCDGHPLKPGK
jgi:predicted Zn-dependent protease